MKEEDKEETDLLIFSGQSNMQGQTESLSDDIPVDGIREYCLLADALIPLKNPVGEDIEDIFLRSYNSHGSLVPYFAKAYKQTCQKNIVVVHAAKGATIAVQWQKNGSENFRYSKLIEKCNGALKK